jgi:hypothetical protein
MALIVRTNHHDRQFKYRDEVPEDVITSEFDWTIEGYEESGDYSDGFILYRGDWSHLGQYVRCTEGCDLKALGYDAVEGHGYTNGVAIKIAPDRESYRIASFYYSSSDNNE